MLLSWIGADAWAARRRGCLPRRCGTARPVGAVDTDYGRGKRGLVPGPGRGNRPPHRPRPRPQNTKERGHWTHVPRKVWFQPKDSTGRQVRQPELRQSRRLCGASSPAPSHRSGSATRPHSVGRSAERGILCVTIRKTPRPHRGCASQARQTRHGRKREVHITPACFRHGNLRTDPRTGVVPRRGSAGRVWPWAGRRPRFTTTGVALAAMPR